MSRANHTGSELPTTISPSRFILLVDILSSACSCRSQTLRPGRILYRLDDFGVKDNFQSVATSCQKRPFAKHEDVDYLNASQYCDNLQLLPMRRSGARASRHTSSTGRGIREAHSRKESYTVYTGVKATSDLAERHSKSIALLHGALERTHRCNHASHAAISVITDRQSTSWHLSAPWTTSLRIG
jgi:hypothetical protein